MSGEGTAPLPLLLWCPMCRARHIDAGEHATKPHHTHACQACGHTWRPAIVATVGVRFLPGFSDAEEQHQELAPMPLMAHGPGGGHALSIMIPADAIARIVLEDQQLRRAVGEALRPQARGLEQALATEMGALLASDEVRAEMRAVLRQGLLDGLRAKAREIVEAMPRAKVLRAAGLQAALEPEG